MSPAQLEWARNLQAICLVALERFVPPELQPKFAELKALAERGNGLALKAQDHLSNSAEVRVAALMELRAVTAEIERVGLEIVAALEAGSGSGSS